MLAFLRGANVVRDTPLRQLAAPARQAFVHRGIAARLCAGYKAPQFNKNTTQPEAEG
jgi:hypothetical protein